MPVGPNRMTFRIISSYLNKSFTTKARKPRRPRKRKNHRVTGTQRIHTRAGGVRRAGRPRRPTSTGGSGRDTNQQLTPASLPEIGRGLVRVSARVRPCRRFAAPAEHVPRCPLRALRALRSTFSLCLRVSVVVLFRGYTAGDTGVTFNGPMVARIMAAVDLAPAIFRTDLGAA